MEETKTIDEPEQLKALSDPRRMEIVKLLVEEPHTVGEIADQLGTERSQLYYHLSELEDLDLIEVVEERKKGNLLEKYYGAVARHYKVDRTLFTDLPEGLEMFMENVIGLFDAAELDLKRLIEEGRLTAESVDQVRRAQRKFRIPADRIDELAKRIEEVFEEFEEEDHELETMLTMVLYPTPGHAGEKSEEGDGD